MKIIIHANTELGKSTILKLSKKKQQRGISIIHQEDKVTLVFGKFLSRVTKGLNKFLKSSYTEFIDESMMELGAKKEDYRIEFKED